MTKTTRIYYPEKDGKFRPIISLNLLKEIQRSETVDMLREAEKRKQDKGA